MNQLYIKRWELIRKLDEGKDRKTKSVRRLEKTEEEMMDMKIGKRRIERRRPFEKCISNC